jgi:hypothetical protein
VAKKRLIPCADRSVIEVARISPGVAAALPPSGDVPTGSSGADDRPCLRTWRPNGRSYFDGKGEERTFGRGLWSGRKTLCRLYE